MRENWIGSLALWRWAIPVLISIGLLAWLIWRVSPEQLLRASASLDWHGLSILTVGLVLALYGWDVLCLRWLFGQPGRSLAFGMVGNARANSYLWSAFNYEAGQGVLAWKLARAQDVPLICSLSRCFLLAVHDLAILLGLGLAGSLLNPFPHTRLMPVFLAGGLGVLASLVVMWKFLPAARRERLMRTRWGMWLGWWTWRHSGHLCLWRLAYYSIILLYAALALRICGIGLEIQDIFGSVPIVMLADSLPSVSGLGTRETTLLSLLRLDSEQEAVVLNLSLFWSAGLMLGRAGIGLTSWWLVPCLSRLTGGTAGWRERIPHEDAGDGGDGPGRQPGGEGTTGAR